MNDVLVPQGACALPQTAAHGEKIEAMKAIVVAIAASKGQIEESGDASRISGRASASVVIRISRRLTLIPVAIGRLSRSAQSGVACVTTGM